MVLYVLTSYASTIWCKRLYIIITQGCALLHCLFILWNVLFFVQIMVLRISLYQEVKNYSSSLSWTNTVLRPLLGPASNNAVLAQYSTPILAQIQHQTICFQFSRDSSNVSVLFSTCSIEMFSDFLSSVVINLFPYLSFTCSHVWNV